MDSTVSSALGDARVYFVEPVSTDDYGCSICLSIVDEPVICGRTEGCATLYCSRCMSKALETKKQCPFCSHPITGKPQKSLQLKNSIQKLDVHCIHADLNGDKTGEGGQKRKAEAVDPTVCSWRGKYSELATHLGNDCPGTEVSCSNAGCPAMVPRGRLEEHGAECSFRREPCEHCGELALRSAMAKHIDENCQRAPVRCVCGSSVPRSAFAAHEVSCPEVACGCQYADLGCGERIKRKDLMKHMESAAEAHNALLLREVVGLRGALVDQKQQTLGLQRETASLQQELAEQKQKVDNQTAILLRELGGQKRELANTMETQSAGHAANLQRQLASLQRTSTLKPITLIWKVEGMAAKIQIAREEAKEIYSPYFDMPDLRGGVSMMHLQMTLTGAKMGLHFGKRPKAYGSSSDCDVDISGWQVSLSGARITTQKTMAMTPGSMCENGKLHGWASFAADVTAYMANDAITITIVVKVNGSGAPIVLANP